MNRRDCLGGLAAVTVARMGIVNAGQQTNKAVPPAEDRKLALKRIVLPRPQTDGGRPLMWALRFRRSTREFKADRLPLQVLSNLLWAAFGVNRPDGRRTAPSAQNWQEIDIYLATADGLFVYDSKAHALNPVLAEDLRGATGVQSFTTTAPVNLVYVADLSRVGEGATGQDAYVPVDAGFIGQNVYLFCASESLATVFRGSVDCSALGKRMRLGPNQKVLFAQTVGYPA